VREGKIEGPSDLWPRSNFPPFFFSPSLYNEKETATLTFTVFLWPIVLQLPQHKTNTIFVNSTTLCPINPEGDKESPKMLFFY